MSFKCYVLAVSICVCACDIFPQPSDPGPAPSWCANEFQEFGPCGPGYSCAHEGLSCVEVDDGAACLPLGAEPSADVLACAATLGTLGCSTDFGFCAIICTGDFKCPADMACDAQSGLCVWPGGVPPVGSTGEMPPPENPTGTAG